MSCKNLSIHKFKGVLAPLWVKQYVVMSSTHLNVLGRIRFDLVTYMYLQAHLVFFLLG